jgi:hypothetical protein
MKAVRLVKWSLVVLAALVVAAVAVVLSTDFGAYKGYAENAVRNATGRSLAIDGPVGLAFLPVPALVAEKVRFANAPWGSRPDMVRVERVEVRLALLPLLSGDVVVKRLVIDGPDILMETDKAGRGNWRMAAARPAAGGEAGAPAIPVIDDVTVKNARLAWRDGRTGASHTLALETLSLKRAGDGAPLDISVTGAVNGRTLDLNGRISRSGADAWTVAGLRASFGGIRLRGEATVHPGATPPRLAASLHAPGIDLGAFGPAGPERTPAGPGDGRMIPAAPLPLDALRALDADISLAADRVVAGRLVFADTTVKMTLKGGKLTLRPLAASLAGGAIEGMATIDSAGAAAVRVSARNVDTARLLAALGSPGALAGKAALDVQLLGRGRTLRTILANADGTAGIVLGKGTIGSGYVDLLGADLVRTLLPGGDRETTRFNCFAAPFVVRKGLAATDAILFDTARMIVRGGGTVNLRDETLDLLLKPEPKEAALFSLATPIRIGGTLAGPTAYPDPEGLARGIAGAVVGVALGPLGLLLPLASMGSGEENPCIAALLKRDGKAAPGKAPPGDRGPAGVLEDLGSTIEKGFRSLFGP